MFQESYMGKKDDEWISQINSKIKDDFQIVNLVDDAGGDLCGRAKDDLCLSSNLASST